MRFAAGMARAALGYALALGIAATLLAWLEYRFLARAFSFEIYLLLVAVGAIGLGAWLGNRLTRRRVPADPFERNAAAIRSLGLSPRELEILDRLAAGDANKEIARKLGISPNTVKTHVGRIYEKLAVVRRTQAVAKARSLALIR